MEQEQQAEVVSEVAAVAAPSKKRRNRWEDAEEAKVVADPQIDNVSTIVNSSSATTLAETSASSVVEGEEAAKKARKSRWGSASEKAVPVAGPLAMGSEEVLQQVVILKLQLQQTGQRLLTVVQDALIIEQNPDRSPSPPPKYDSQGKRTNTREVRMRESLINQRTEIIEQLIKLSPSFVPPLDYVRTKPVRRIYIPKNADPMVNYIGLIIGPRGMTQKELEQETGCKISIRGKGSAKEGSKGRANKSPDDDEELHVHIQGETTEMVEFAAKKVEVILRPLDDNLNEHKQKQLKQLALINGTLRENEYCPVCGEKGHQQFDCPYRAKAFKAAGVKCSICGDLSHPTRDCPMRDEPVTNESVIDSEYDSFLAELTGGGGPSKPKLKATSSIASDKGSSSADINLSGIDDAKSATSNSARPASSGGPTILAPIVDMFSRTSMPMSTANSSTTPTAAAAATMPMSWPPMPPALPVVAPAAPPLPTGYPPMPPGAYAGYPYAGYPGYYNPYEAIVPAVPGPVPPIPPPPLSNYGMQPPPPPPPPV